MRRLARGQCSIVSTRKEIKKKNVKPRASYRVGDSPQEDGMLGVSHRPEGSSAIDGLGRNRLHELADLVRNAAQEEEDGNEHDDAREVGGGGDVL